MPFDEFHILWYLYQMLDLWNYNKWTNEWIQHHNLLLTSWNIFIICDYSVPPLNPLNLTKHCCFRDNTLPDTQHNYFPISRDVAVTFPPSGTCGFNCVKLPTFLLHYFQVLSSLRWLLPRKRQWLQQLTW